MTAFNLGFLVSPLGIGLSPLGIGLWVLVSLLVSPLVFDGIGAGSESSRFLRIKSSARLFLLFFSGAVTISVSEE